MISQRTAFAIAEAYAVEFGGESKYYVPYTYKLYDFLFSNNCADWLCELYTAPFKNGDKSAGTRQLKLSIMHLHNGQTIAIEKPNWTRKRCQAFGQEHLKDLAIAILNWWYSCADGFRESRPDLAQKISNLVRYLELDGYIYRNSHFLTVESEVLDTTKENGLLRNLYTTLQLGNKETAFHHLSLSEEHYIDSKWDDSISNSRKFLECVLQEVAKKHSLEVNGIALPENVFSRPVEVRKYLEKESILEQKEVDALRGTYGLLSDTGSHPYMAQNDQARLLRHLSLTFAQFVMLRVQGKLKRKA